MYRSLAGARDGVRKGVWPRAGGLEVWDVADYPAERRDAEAPRAPLRSARTAFERRVPEGRPQEAPMIVEPEIVDALRRLGYMDDEEDPPLE